MKSIEFLREDQPDSKNKSATINIPITITLPIGGGEPIIDTSSENEDDDEQPVMVPPLQQHIELQKQQSGKQSKVVNQLVADEEDTSEQEDPKEVFNLSESQDYKKLLMAYNKTRNKKY